MKRMRNIGGFFKKLLKKINPVPPVGALAIGDAVLRFLLIDENQYVTSASLRLPPQVIVKGNIADKDVFIASLRQLKKTITKSKVPLHVVLVLPPGLAYVQPFSLPFLPEDRLREAAALNLQMISPLDFSHAYAGYEKIGNHGGEGGSIDMLGAFVEQSAVRQFSEALESAGFAVTAVEFPALGLARVAEQDRALSLERAYVLLNIEEDGVSLIILKNLHLYFAHFEGWHEIQEGIGGPITRENFQVFLEREIQKLMNFYSTRWGSSVAEIVIAAGPRDAGFENAISSAMKLPVRNLTAKDFSLPGPAWLPVLGSAIRGVLPRSEDDRISLTDAPVQVHYREARILNFVRSWRKAMLTVTIFILLLFIGADSFLARGNFAMTAVMQAGANGQEFTEVRALEERAREFNSLVNLLIAAQSAQSPWIGAMENLENLAGSPITFKRFAWNGQGATLTGVANDIDALIAFKKKLIDSGLFAEVVLPITTIIGNPDETLNFSATLTLKS